MYFRVVQQSRDALAFQVVLDGERVGLTSVEFRDQAAVQRAIEAVIASLREGVDASLQVEGDRYFFALRGEDGALLARGAPCPSPADADLGLAELQRGAAVLERFRIVNLARPVRSDETIQVAVRYDLAACTRADRPGLELLNRPGDGLFTAHVHGERGDVLLYLRGFTTRFARDEHVETVLHAAADPRRYDRREADGRRYFVLTARNGREIARGPWFGADAERDAAIAELVRLAPQAARADLRAQPRRKVDAGHGFAHRSTSGLPGFEAFRGDDGHHYFHLNDERGEALLYSHGYSTAKARDHGVRSLLKGATDPTCYRLAGDGLRFTICAVNGRELARSRIFPDRPAMDRAIAWVRQHIVQFGRACGIRLWESMIIEVPHDPDELTRQALGGNDDNLTRLAPPSARDGAPATLAPLSRGASDRHSSDERAERRPTRSSAPPSLSDGSRQRPDEHPTTPSSATPNLSDGSRQHPDEPAGHHTTPSSATPSLSDGSRQHPDEPAEHRSARSPATPSPAEHRPTPSLAGLSAVSRQRSDEPAEHHTTPSSATPSLSDLLRRQRSDEPGDHRPTASGSSPDDLRLDDSESSVTLVFTCDPDEQSTFDPSSPWFPSTVPAAQPDESPRSAEDRAPRPEPRESSADLSTAASAGPPEDEFDPLADLIDALKSDDSAPSVSASSADSAGTAAQDPLASSHQALDPPPGALEHQPSRSTSPETIEPATGALDSPPSPDSLPSLSASPETIELASGALDSPPAPEARELASGALDTLPSVRTAPTGFASTRPSLGAPPEALELASDALDALPASDVLSASPDALEPSSGALDSRPSSGTSSEVIEPSSGALEPQPSSGTPPEALEPASHALDALPAHDALDSQSSLGASPEIIESTASTLDSLPSSGTPPEALALASDAHSSLSVPSDVVEPASHALDALPAPDASPATHELISDADGSLSAPGDAPDPQPPLDAPPETLETPPGAQPSLETSHKSTGAQPSRGASPERIEPSPDARVAQDELGVSPKNIEPSLDAHDSQPELGASQNIEPSPDAHVAQDELGASPQNIEPSLDAHDSQPELGASPQDIESSLDAHISQPELGASPQDLEPAPDASESRSSLSPPLEARESTAARESRPALDTSLEAREPAPVSLGSRPASPVHDGLPSDAALREAAQEFAAAAESIEPLDAPVIAAGSTLAEPPIDQATASDSAHSSFDLPRVRTEAPLLPALEDAAPLYRLQAPPLEAPAASPPASILATAESADSATTPHGDESEADAPVARNSSTTGSAVRAPARVTSPERVAVRAAPPPSLDGADSDALPSASGRSPASAPPLSAPPADSASALPLSVPPADSASSRPSVSAPPLAAPPAEPASSRHHAWAPPLSAPPAASTSAPALVAEPASAPTLSAPRVEQASASTLTAPPADLAAAPAPPADPAPPLSAPPAASNRLPTSAPPSSAPPAASARPLSAPPADPAAVPAPLAASARAPLAESATLASPSSAPLAEPAAAPPLSAPPAEPASAPALIAEPASAPALIADPASAPALIADSASAPLLSAPPVASALPSSAPLTESAATSPSSAPLAEPASASSLSAQPADPASAPALVAEPASTPPLSAPSAASALLSSAPIAEPAAASSLSAPSADPDSVPALVAEPASTPPLSAPSAASALLSSAPIAEAAAASLSSAPPVDPVSSPPSSAPLAESAAASLSSAPLAEPASASPLSVPPAGLVSAPAPLAEPAAAPMLSAPPAEPASAPLASPSAPSSAPPRTGAPPPAVSPSVTTIPPSISATPSATLHLAPPSLSPQSRELADPASSIPPPFSPPGVPDPSAPVEAAPDGAPTWVRPAGPQVPTLVPRSAPAAVPPVVAPPDVGARPAPAFVPPITNPYPRPFIPPGTLAVPGGPHRPGTSSAAAARPLPTTPAAPVSAASSHDFAGGSVSADTRDPSPPLVLSHDSPATLSSAASPTLPALSLAFPAPTRDALPPDSPILQSSGDEAPLASPAGAAVSSRLLIELAPSTVQLAPGDAPSLVPELDVLLRDPPIPSPRRREGSAPAFLALREPSSTHAVPTLARREPSSSQSAPALVPALDALEFDGARPRRSLPNLIPEAGRPGASAIPTAVERPRRDLLGATVAVQAPVSKDSAPATPAPAVAASPDTLLPIGLAATQPAALSVPPAAPPAPPSVAVPMPTAASIRWLGPAQQRWLGIGVALALLLFILVRLAWYAQRTAGGEPEVAEGASTDLSAPAPPADSSAATSDSEPPPATAPAVPALTCPEEQDDDPTVGLLVVPFTPVAGEPARLVAAVLDDERDLSLHLLEVSAPLESHTRRGPPAAVLADWTPRAAGEYTVAIADSGAVRACRTVRVDTAATSEPAGLAPPGRVWPVERAWDGAEEALYSAWVRELFRAPLADEPSIARLDQLTTDPARNLLHGALGLGEDDPDVLSLKPDGGDLPYFLRAYWSWKRRLPFTYHKCGRGGSQQPARCGSPRHSFAPGPGYSGQEDELVRVQRFFQRNIAWGVQPGNVHTALGDSDSDLYPVRLERRALRPGAVYADPHGQVFVVVGLDLAQGGQPGGLWAIDGDGALTRRRFWEGEFSWAPDLARASAGFKQFRPIVRGEGGALVQLDDKALAESPVFGDIWPTDLAMTGRQFHDAVAALLEPPPWDPSRLQREAVAALAELARARVEPIARAVEYARGHKRAIAMPRGAAVFEATGAWESYSTPGRDLRLLIALDVVRQLPDRVRERPDLFIGGDDPEAAARALELELDALLRDPAVAITYARSDGSPWTLTLRDLIDRSEALERAYNPNDCPELRWGAPQGSDELATCSFRAPADQRKRMEANQAWFRQRRLP